VLPDQEYFQELALALKTGGQGQGKPEAGAGIKALGVLQFNSRNPKQPLPKALKVQVGYEAKRPQFAELQNYPLHQLLLRFSGFMS
jgi:hypothetical protein